MNANTAAADVTRVRGVPELGLWEAWQVWRAEQDAASVAELSGHGDAAYHVRQAVLEDTIGRRIRAFATVSVHCALVAGADVAEIAGALGVEVGEVVDRWRRWADGQRRLNERYPGLGVKPDEFVVVDVAVTESLSRRARTGVVQTQVGSPGP